MPRRGGKHYTLVKGAEEALDAFKMEIVREMGLADKLNTDKGYRGLTTEEVGKIGGEMVRRIQAAGEWAIKKRYEAGERRLLPEDVLPANESIRNISNNGNPAPSMMLVANAQQSARS